ncbi:TPA: hypothetical protein ACS32N_001710 [Yersinia enterocolitica]
MSKLKPYTAAQRGIFDKLAAVLVCSEIERKVIAQAYEKAKGTPYDATAPMVFSTHFYHPILNMTAFGKHWREP